MAETKFDIDSIKPGMSAADRALAYAAVARAQQDPESGTRSPEPVTPGFEAESPALIEKANALYVAHLLSEQRPAGSLDKNEREFLRQSLRAYATRGEE
jgi:hypothetical protein